MERECGAQPGVACILTNDRDDSESKRMASNNSRAGLKRYFEALSLEGVPTDDKVARICECFAPVAKLIDAMGNVHTGLAGAKHFFCSSHSPVLRRGFHELHDESKMCTSADGKTIAVRKCLKNSFLICIVSVLILTWIGLLFSVTQSLRLRTGELQKFETVRLFSSSRKAKTRMKAILANTKRCVGFVWMNAP